MNKQKTFILGIFSIILALTLTTCEEPTEPIKPTKPTEPTVTLTSINALYTGTAAVYPSTSLNNLKADLTVTAYYSDSTTAPITNYRLSVNGGTLTVPASTVTVTYQGKTDTFTVTVTADITYTIARADGADGTADTTAIVFTFSASVDSLELTAADITVGRNAEKGTATLSGSGTTRTLAPIIVNEAGTATVSINKTSIEAGTKHVTVYKAGESAPILTGITAVYNGTAAIYPTTPLNNLKAHLTVKAQYSNGSENTLSEHEYTLSGTLTVGTSTVTVTYTDSDGVTKTTSFNVTVTATVTEMPPTEGLAYELINNGTAYRVRKGTVTGGAVVIPAAYNGLPVTEIGSVDDEWGAGAFESTSITSVTIPASVTTIGYSAFRLCSGLTTVTFASGSQLQTIGRWAFCDCTGLTGITIPASVTSIGNSAFRNCTSLTSITIPAGVTAIDNYAFCDCSGLTGITIPNSVTSIGIGTFSDCTSLTSITIPFGVTSIGQEAFYNCTGITSITIPNSVTSIGDGAFSGCTSLTSITIPEGVTSIGDWAFYDCTSLTSITIPEGVTSIGFNAFGYCSGLTSITIPASVTSIRRDAFDGCTSLTDIIIDTDKITNFTSNNYNWGTIFSADNLSVTFKRNPGNNAFYDCTSLTSVTIAEDVTTIGSNAFYGCTGLTSVTIPASVTTMGSNAFYSWTSSQTIYVRGYANQTAANTAWGSSWLNNCNAVIRYWNGSSYQ